MTAPFITIASYNVLADALIRPEHFPAIDPAVLAKDARYPRIVQRVVGLHTDVICLQEVDYELFRMLVAALLPLGYRGRWAEKDGKKTDGVATFARLPFHWKEAVIYSLGDPTRTDSAGHPALVTYVSSGKRSLVVSNVHLKWDEPSLPESEHAGYRQAAELLDNLPGTLMDKAVCGDFNAGPDSPILDLFKRRHGYYDAIPVDYPTCVTDGRPLKTDYVMTKGFSTIDSVTPRIPEVSLLPSLLEPSDHVPIIVTLRRWPR